MENFISRNETTKAFNDYAHKIFQRQIKLRIDDIAFDFDHGVVSELNLRKAIAEHLSGWLLINMPDWKDVKSKYLQDCKNKSLNQDEFSELKNEFETLAKLHYCGNMVKSADCVAAADLDVLNILMSLQYRIQNYSCGDKLENLASVDFSNTEFDELQKTPIYKYLSHVSYETKNMKTSYKEIFNIPINEFVDKLFNRVVALQFKYDNTVTCPVWEPYDNGKYVQD